MSAREGNWEGACLEKGLELREGRDWESVVRGGQEVMETGGGGGRCGLERGGEGKHRGERARGCATPGRGVVVWEEW